MALSTAASKLLKWLGMYRLTATQLDARLDDSNQYHRAWVDGGISSSPRRSYATKGSLFGAAMQELKTAGY